MSNLITRWPLASYVALAYAWTWGWQLPLLLSRRGLLAAEISELFEVTAAFGPLIAAALVIAATHGGAGLREWGAGFLRWRVGARGAALALASPFLLLALALLLVGAGSGRWPAAGALEGGKLATAGGWLHLLVISGLVQGLGEEPGWRGYLHARLRERRTLLMAVLLLFPVWLLWHLPAFLGRPAFGVPQFVAFSFGILAAAVWLAHIMERTGSLLMAILWHALINFARGIALALSTPHFLTMSTLVLAGAVLIVAGWLVRARRQRVAVS